MRKSETKPKKTILENIIEKQCPEHIEIVRWFLKSPNKKGRYEKLPLYVRHVVDACKTALENNTSEIEVKDKDRFFVDEVEAVFDAREPSFAKRAIHYFTEGLKSTDNHPLKSNHIIVEIEKLFADCDELYHTSILMLYEKSRLPKLEQEYNRQVEEETVTNEFLQLTCGKTAAEIRDMIMLLKSSEAAVLV